MTTTINGIAAVIDTANLDTDQIMPKQFLHGIDKRGLAKGVLWDRRFDADGRPREDFVLNRSAWRDTRVLVTGPNFGCGSSREHAVWGLRQFGIDAVIAASFGEIFYSNALNNGLVVAQVDPFAVDALMAEARDEPLHVTVDLATMTVRSPTTTAAFTLSQRHRRMLIDGLDLIDASLVHRDAIDDFAAKHWAGRPWLRDVASTTAKRIGLTSASCDRAPG